MAQKRTAKAEKNEDLNLIKHYFYNRQIYNKTVDAIFFKYSYIIFFFSPLSTFYVFSFFFSHFFGSIDQL